MGCAGCRSRKARGCQGNSGRSCNADAKRSLKYKCWCRSIFSLLTTWGKESTRRKSLFITIKEPDFSTSHRTFKDSERLPCKHPQTSEVRVRRTVLDAHAALPKAEPFRWKNRLFGGLAAPFGSRQTSVELLSACSCLTQPPLFSFHLQLSCCCYSCFSCHCYSISPITITGRDNWEQSHIPF